MKKKALLAIFILTAAVGLYAGTFYFYNLRGIWPALKEPSGFPELKLPAGFSIEVWAENLPGARVMTSDAFGNMWVSRPGAGAVTLLEVQNGKVVRQSDIFTGLNKPHGLAFDPESPFSLYIAEEDKIIRVPVYSEYDSKK